MENLGTKKKVKLQDVKAEDGRLVVKVKVAVVVKPKEAWAGLEDFMIGGRAYLVG